MVKKDAIQVVTGTNGDSEGVSIPGRISYDPYLVKLMKGTGESEREQALEAVLSMGSLALLDDRISAFLEDAGGQIASRFEQLKVLHDLRRSAWNRGSNKGKIGEQWVDDALSEYAVKVGWDDKFTLTGDQRGVISGATETSVNKSGDVLAITDQGKRISIEVKFDDISGSLLSDRDYSKKAPDSAWSQIVEGIANRNADVGFIVFDRSTMNSALMKGIPDIGYLEGAGLVCVVDWERGKRENLIAAYSIARALAHMPNFSRSPEAVASLVSHAQAVVEELSMLNTFIDDILKSTKETEKIAFNMSEAIATHLATLAAIGTQLQTAKERELTAEDQIEHFKGADIMELVKAHKKRRKSGGTQ
jgi:hypothetical protein